jgi:ParB family transcriptional regulator, chromosome partitioning protein
MAKSGIQGMAEARSDLFRINPDLIVVKEGWNARDFDDPDNQAHVEALALSIQEVGVKEPLTVYMEDGAPVLTNGESRWRAIQLLKSRGVIIATVPVQTEAKHSSDADRLASQIIRNSGRPFSVLEQSQVYVRLLDYGMTEAQIAARAGVTTERIRQIVSLNAAPVATRKLVKEGRVSATVVQRVIAKSQTAQEVNDKVRAAVAKAESQGRKRAAPRDFDRPRKPAAAPITPDTIMTLAEMVQNGDVDSMVAALAGTSHAKIDLVTTVLQVVVRLTGKGHKSLLAYLNGPEDDEAEPETDGEFEE